MQSHLTVAQIKARKADKQTSDALPQTQPNTEAKASSSSNSKKDDALFN